MRQTFDGTDVAEDRAERYVRSMLIRSKEDLRTDTIRITEYQTDNPIDNTASVNAGELLARGTVSFSRETLDGRYETATHQFTIRAEGETEVQVDISDHANALS